MQNLVETTNDGWKNADRVVLEQQPDVFRVYHLLDDADREKLHVRPKY
jgi:hypothetical protein